MQASLTKACCICSKEFRPFRSLQTVCGRSCAAKVGKTKRKKEAETDSRRRESLKSLSELEDEAQAEINRYVRLRDRNDGCISCDKPATWGGQWHASHLRSRGAASGLRFHLWNIHKACSICNNHLSGNIAEYLPRVRAKIGDDKVDWLFAQNAPVKRTREYVKRLKAVIAKRRKRLEKRL